MKHHAVVKLKGGSRVKTRAGFTYRLYGLKPMASRYKEGSNKL